MGILTPSQKKVSKCFIVIYLPKFHTIITITQMPSTGWLGTWTLRVKAIEESQLSSIVNPLIRPALVFLMFYSSAVNVFRVSRKYVPFPEGPGTQTLRLQVIAFGTYNLMTGYSHTIGCLVWGLYTFKLSSPNPT